MPAQEEVNKKKKKKSWFDTQDCRGGKVRRVEALLCHRGRDAGLGSALQAACPHGAARSREQGVPAPAGFLHFKAFNALLCLGVRQSLGLFRKM